MSDQLLTKFKSILNEAQLASGGKIDKLSANYNDMALGNHRCRTCKNYLMPNRCKIVEGMISPDGWCKYWGTAAITEKWDVETQVSPGERGKYDGKTKAELLRMYNALKRTGPHHKDSPAYGRMRELAFAIRAKSDWGKIK